MNVAIIYSGATRSFERCLPNHWWHVLRYFKDAKVFIATQKDEDSPKAELIREYFPDAIVKADIVQPKMVLPKGCPELWTHGTPYMHEPYFISVKPGQVLGQLWMLDQAWQLFQDSGYRADLVIRIRPDLWFHTFQKPAGLSEVDPCIAYTPWWGKFGGVNDRFALLGSQAASAYFQTFSYLDTLIEMGAPLHPETLVATALRYGEASICSDLLTEFSTLRKTGEMRPPEIQASDIAHLVLNR